MPRLNVLPQRLPAALSSAIGRGVGRTGITPNMISLFGLTGNALAAYLVVREALLWAGAVFLIFSALDMVDGAVARATNSATPFGAVFDAVLDRVTEALLLCACGWYFAERGEQVQAAIAYAALFGSVAVSYIRARAEVMGLLVQDGLFRRQERVALMSGGLLLNGLTAVIWPLAILSNITALQRFWLVAKGLRELDRAESRSSQA